MTTLVSQNVEQMAQGAVYALARSSQYLYAARISGLYRSQDDGATWQNAFASLELAQPISVTAVETAGNTIFAGINGAVLRSEEGSDNWHVAGLSSPAPYVVALAASPNYSEDGVVVAGTAEDGVFVSTDQGMNWVPWNFGLVDLNVYAVCISPDFRNDRTIFVGTESGVFRSRNGGRAWRATSFPMDAAPVSSLGVSPTYVTDGLVYAGTERHGLFASNDLGLNWRQIGNELISTSVNAIYTVAQPVEEVWLLLEDRLVYSADKGRSWRQYRSQFPSGKTAMAMMPLHGSSGIVMVGFADGDILPLR